MKRNREQHKAKNIYSKGDDKTVLVAMERVIGYLNARLRIEELGYKLEYVRSVKLTELMALIQSYDKRVEFASLAREDSFIKPDGGILILRSKNDKDFKRIVLVVEMKRQGTNDQRLKEGKQKQAQGNAIDRLGKNLIGIRATLQYEKITPFVTFGWGVDFAPTSSILDRVITMNEFYPLNQIFVFKREGYAPISMFFRENIWSTEEVYEIMKEVAETSIRYYLF